MAFRNTLRSVMASQVGASRLPLARSFASMRGQPSRELLKKQTHSGAVVDAIDHDYIDTQGYIYFSPNWFRYQKRRFNDGLVSTYAVSKMKKGMDYVPSEFPDEGYRVFANLNRAIVTADKDRAKESVVTPLFTSMNQLLAKGPLKADPYRPTHTMRIVGLVSRPTTVQARVLAASKVANDLEFAQCTILVKTLQSVIDQNDLVNPLGKKAHLKKTKARQQQHNFILPKPQADTNRWKPVYANGDRYFWNTSTGKTQWEPPQALTIQKASYDIGNGTLGNGKVVGFNEEEGVYTVENYVTLERPMFNISIPWKVVRF